MKNNINTILKNVISVRKYNHQLSKCFNFWKVIQRQSILFEVLKSFKENLIHNFCYIFQISMPSTTLHITMFYTQAFMDGAKINMDNLFTVKTGAFTCPHAWITSEQCDALNWLDKTFSVKQVSMLDQCISQNTASG